VRSPGLRRPVYWARDDRAAVPGGRGPHGGTGRGAQARGRHRVRPWRGAGRRRRGGRGQDPAARRRRVGGDRCRAAGVQRSCGAGRGQRSPACSITSTGPVLASRLKRAVLRRNPTFDEADHGFRGFGELLRHLEGEHVRQFRAGSAQGDPEVTFLEDGSEVDEAFAVLVDVVRQLRASGHAAAQRAQGPGCASDGRASARNATASTRSCPSPRPRRPATWSGWRGTRPRTSTCCRFQTRSPERLYHQRLSCLNIAGIGGTLMVGLAGLLVALVVRSFRRRRRTSPSWSSRGALA
jgi:hypothetical protein